MSDDITRCADCVGDCGGVCNRHGDITIPRHPLRVWFEAISETTRERLNDYEVHLYDAIRAQLAPARPEPEGDDWWATYGGDREAAPAWMIHAGDGWDAWIKEYPYTIILRPEGSPHALGSLTPRDGHDWRIGTVTPGHVSGFDWLSECDCGWSMQAGTRGEIYRGSELHAAGLLTKENNT